MQILNTMRRSFIVPTIGKAKGKIIRPGALASIDDNVWKEISRNTSVKALIAQRCLEVYETTPKGLEEITDFHKLENAEPRKAPADLTESDDPRIERKGAKEAVSVPGDAPAGGKKAKGK